MIQNKQYWLDLIQQCRASGLTDRQWCMQNNIAPSTFYYRVRKLRTEACEVPEAVVPFSQKQEVVQVDFHACTESSDYASPKPAVRISLHGFVLDILNSADEIAITNTIRALQRLC